MPSDMKVKKSTIQPLIQEINSLLIQIRRAEEKYIDLLQKVHPENHKSAINLVHYRALRSKDLRDLQKQLGALGLSRLARAEGHVMASLNATRGILKSMISEKPAQIERAFLSIKKGNKLISSHAKALLGYRSKGRRVRIMVTMPSTAADDYELVHGLVEHGMNSARVNCAHDTPEVWLKIIENVRTASKRLRKNVRVCMDLGGPKIRTGSMRPGPRVVTFAPDRDSFGNVIGPASLHLVPCWYPLAEDVVPVPLSPAFLSRLQPGERLIFEDTRGKKRTLKIIAAEGDGWIAHCYDRAYIQTGTVVLREDDGTEDTVGDLPPIEEKIMLRQGDLLILHKDPRDGEPAVIDEDGIVHEPAHISCTSPLIFDKVREGERILFDDGKIEGEVVTAVPGEELHVRVTYASKGGQKLKADKGINFPSSRLYIKGLTEKDKRDLAFVTQHADVVNMSFVNTPEDVQDLLDVLDVYQAKDRVGIILKIETMQGFENLTEIMLTAMQTYPVGVMIARGDLAVEVGWENMPRIQEEILALCMAAHMPDVWATQVLENLAKKGLPSRAEITDAARSQRAECVMLNKGPYIVDAIQLLDKILKNLKDHRDKNAPMSPVLH